MLAHSLFFYFFSTVTVFSAIMVTVSRNTVYSVFFLILVFISISILFIMIGAEFLGMIMLIVYVGAVAVLFLFVVMMLNITEQVTKRPARKGFINNVSVGSIVGIIILALNTGTLRISEILYQSTHNYEKLSTVAFVAAIVYYLLASK